MFRNTGTKKVMLSGVKPTGRPHIGNFFGAMKQFVELQDEYNCLVMIADLHALTTVSDPKQLKSDILDLAIDYLAIGLDPAKVILFRQSDVSAHTELTWIFNCITTVPYLMRAHAYKDAIAKNKEVSVGTFDYPMLMAADILLYSPDVVPVGADQKQHVEYARDTAEKFNRLFGDTFKLPESLIIKDVEIVPGVDGQKMSKSYGNTIPLFAEKDEITKLVMSIKTDSKGADEPKDPNADNVFSLHKLFSNDDLAVIEKRYREGGLSYKESKEILIENMDKFIAPLRTKRKAIAENPEQVKKMFAAGGEKARIVANQKMKEVKERVGLSI